jgi:hypothetical protein
MVKQWTVHLRHRRAVTIMRGDCVILRDCIDGIGRQLFQVNDVGRQRGKTALYGRYLDGWGSYVFRR